MKVLGQLAVALLLCAAAAAETPQPAPDLDLACPSLPGVHYVATLSNGFAISFDHRRVIEGGSRLFTSASDDNYIDLPGEQIVELSTVQSPVPQPAPVAVKDVRSVIAAASDKHRVDADLIDSVIRAESGFNPKAKSRKGAQGLMQLMPQTAQRLGVRDAYDPEANVDGGARFLRELLLRYNDNMAKALAAYNAGPGRVQQFGGVPPYRETRAYVARVIRDYNRKKLAARPARTKDSSASSGAAVGAGSGS